MTAGTGLLKLQAFAEWCDRGQPAEGRLESAPPPHPPRAAATVRPGKGTPGGDEEEGLPASWDRQAWEDLQPQLRRLIPHMLGREVDTVANIEY
jgi:hypothetical protein